MMALKRASAARERDTVPSTGGAALPDSRTLARFETDLYRYALEIGVALLRGRRLKPALRHLIQPISYWRSVEYRLVWGAAGFGAADRVLDIGSPKLLSLYVAERTGAEIYSTDLLDYFVEEWRYLSQARRVAPERFHVETADGRALPYPDAFFSKVYSISVIEHIPDDGDSDCLREIGRVLAPGGRCLLTVPFWPTSQDVYHRPDFYFAASSPTNGGGLVFFQRRYSEEDLQRRLIRPSGLHLTRLLYVGERVGTRNDRREFCEVAPMLITSPLHPVLSRLVHTRPAASWHTLRKPLCAFLELTKPR